MKIVTVAQMVAMEQATDAAGFSYEQMMAAAGRALAAATAETIAGQGPLTAPILFLIGPGNNGGDGLVACAHLQGLGAPARPYIWKRKREGDPLLEAVKNVAWAEQDSDYVKLVEMVEHAGVIVDALLGTGATRPIGGDLADLLRAVHDALETRHRAQPGLFDPARPTAPARPLVIACDCPSGLNCDTGGLDPLALSADQTVTFALPKAGHFLQPGASACGQLTIADIGIDRRLAPTDAPDLLTPAEVAALLPARPAAGHKGTFGTALIVAGSRNYPGAAAIACQSAYRAGAGLVRLAATAPVGQLVADHLPEAVHSPLPSHPLADDEQAAAALSPAALPPLRHLLPAADALLVGPGLGARPETFAFVRRLLLAEAGNPPELPPLLADADALNALADQPDGPALLPPGSILTPHPGEMARLTGLSTKEINANRWQVARRFAAAWGQIVVLKGAFTAVAHPDGALAISPFADAALATAGSGDALAGAIVGLLAQGLDTWAAARAGVYLHALAGRLAAQSLGPTLLASDIAHHLTPAWAQMQRLV
ncbi:MAG: NAD(P)H-hydrate dehydratase [Caldilineales bacterium]|nr:NAD(P)H-hydrate dehydratase [Caldilineales bacterium]MCW5859997.1 NAD(P)H-hydrate dehydratase [Caldilineales bacterium]